MSRLQSSKPTKQCGANNTSPRKQEKFDVEAIAEVEDVLGADKGDPTTLSQYTLTAFGVCRLVSKPEITL